ncbi:MAG: hypothetical protein JWN40_5753 [Phycisphaerales bacterium]|nr:hypothetical protein [Phycisphaerales bacterium]
MLHLTRRARRLRLVSVAAALGLCTIAGTTRAAGLFSDTNYTGDSDSNINAGAAYTHALNFLTDDNLSINGAVFTGTGSGAVAPATNTYSITGTNQPFHGNANNLVGNSNGLAKDFVYNGNPQVTTLNNLIVGQSYVTTFYNVGFGPVGDRVVDIATSDGGVLLGYDQNKAGNGNGNRLSYSFVATANTQTFTITPQNPGNTFHNYALSNRLVGYNALLSDNFYIGTANGDPGGNALLNSNLPARQGGTTPIASGGNVTYSNSGNVQVGNGPTGPVDRGNYLLTAFGGAASPNHNFNGTDAGIIPNSRIIVSFDMAPNLAPIDPSDWGGISLGLSQAHQTAFINDGAPHFGILFRGNGGIQVFDGGSDITGSGTAGPGARWYADDGVNNVTNQLHHFDFILSGPTLATIDVYADGQLFDSFTKVGGFSDGGNNYINLVGSRVAGFDNLLVSEVPEPAALGVLGLGAAALLVRRRRSIHFKPPLRRRLGRPTLP